ncbi:MAG: S8 family serine peptidase [Trueperaceae bacterium]
MARRNYSRIAIYMSLFLFLGALVACQSGESPETFSQLSVTAEIDLDYALRGEVVSVKLFGDNSSSAAVTVGGVPAQVTVLTGNTFEFPVPEDAPTGRQPLVIELDTRTLLDTIYVLGDDVVEREFMLVLEPGSTEEDLAAALEGIDYELLAGPYSLGADAGLCSGERVEIRISGLGTGKALTELNSLTDGGTILYSDPQTGYSSGTTDHLAAIGGHAPRLRGVTGAGTTIAVLDTGVSNHVELGARLLLDQGYDFVDLGSSPVDTFPGGHGTPIAVLAAGSLSGVAPAARVLPVRVCDDNGICYTDDILAGICHSLATAQNSAGGMGELILNLSFGGDTPVQAIEDVLQYALENGVLVAASAGNEGEFGSPVHYPAAFELDGVVAVGGLHASATEELLGNWKPASFSTRGDYVDIAAPATNLTSGSPDGLYRSDYTGTSYSAALAAGALALWREVHPSLSPAEVEAALKAAAKPLPYSQAEVGAGMLDLSTDPR